MILTFTDFGSKDPYLAQMKAVILQSAPGVPVLDLFTHAPAFSPKASAYLLAAYATEFAQGSVFLCVVDPGVGGARDPLVVRAGGRWFVGPDNGLLAISARREADARAWRITWQPPRLSASFHGRDLFAPIAARLALGKEPPGEPIDANTLVGMDWPDNLAEVVYVDHYGNAMTGLRASTLKADALLEAGGRRLKRARTFSDVPEGEAFWYENANGLAEISVNRGSAARALALEPGTPVAIVQE